jgi:hypothetical protein
MQKSVRFLLILTLILLIIDGVLTRIYFISKYQGSPKISVDNFSLESEVPGLQLTWNDENLLLKYAQNYGAFKKNSIIIFKDSVNTKMVTAKKIVFSYSPQIQFYPLIMGANEPVLSYNATGPDSNGVVKVSFNNTLLDPNQTSNADQVISDALVHILYRMTHSNYISNDIMNTLNELNKQNAIVKVEVQK